MGEHDAYDTEDLDSCSRSDHRGLCWAQRTISSTTTENAAATTAAANPNAADATASEHGAADGSRHESGTAYESANDSAARAPGISANGAANGADLQSDAPDATADGASTERS